MNVQLELIAEGKQGSGKTTLLNEIKEFLETKYAVKAIEFSELGGKEFLDLEIKDVR